MKKFVFFFFVLFFSANAMANIAISPFFIEFNANANKRSDQVRFTNTSNDEKIYTIKLVNFKQETNGDYTKISTPVDQNPFADKYLDYSPHQVTLKPLESQVVRIQRRGMPTANDGEYVSHLLIQELPPKNNQLNKNNKEKLEINLQAIYGVSIPVMIRKGDLSATANIKKTKISSKDGKYTADVTVERSGTRSFYGGLIVTDGKKEIGKIANFRIFMTAKFRQIKVPLTRKPTGVVSVTLVNEIDNEVLESKSI